MIKIDRPLAFFDLEATGTDTDSDRIIEIGILRLVPEEHNEAEEKVAENVYTGRKMNKLVNPMCPIPEEVSDITGIETGDVIDEPAFSRVIDGIASMFADADLAGFNILRYDIPLLQSEFERCGRSLPGPEDQSVVDVYKLEKALQSRSLEGLYEKYAGKSLEASHRALADVKGTVSVLHGQMNKYDPDISGPKEAEDFVKGDYLDHDRKLLMSNPDKVNKHTVVLQFGKHKGKSVEWVEENEFGYLEWMIEEIDEISNYLNDLIQENQISA